MADIYEGAFITIAATRSSDSEGGCFSRSQGLSQPTRLDSSGLFACKVLVDFPLPAYSLASDGGPWPLLPRAWVFQERFLSTRVVHFTDYQVIWECRSMQESESGSIRENWIEDDWTVCPPVEHPFEFPHEDNIPGWQRGIANYSHLQLT
jgi:hypothetical protein